MTPEENFRELYRRVAQLNDKVSALLNPRWGAEAGILPADHPLAPTTENAQQEQGAPVDWKVIAERREQELRVVGEARRKAEAAVTRVREETARMRTITRTWEPAADLIDAALDGPIREQRKRPTHPDGTPYRYHEIVAEGWGHCDGCGLWSTGTPRRPHQCAETHTQGPAQDGAR